VINAAGAFIDPSLHVNGQVEAQMACGSCHAVPPATGTHLLHVGLQGSRIYGSLSTAASVTSPTGYAFGCGNCHPTDSSRHLSGGRADIELYNPTAPPGSLKARSPLAVYTPGPTVFTDDAGIPYTQGTCSSVYCHSGPAYATPNPVLRPGVDFSFVGYPVTYPAFALDVSRSYQTVTWGSTGVGCAGCHGFPIRTSEPQVHAGVGQSHSFLDTNGFENGHAFNHGGTPLSCRTCHFDTVTALNATGRVGGLSTYGPVPISGFAQHVNGLPDVAFDRVNALAVSGRVQSLVSASYSQPTRTCSNVACHKSQSAVVNGSPYRPALSIECNVCHQY
jgi:predicted CxxxxCH...CXXCH cytochrome family protein